MFLWFYDVIVQTIDHSVLTHAINKVNIPVAGHVPNSDNILTQW